MGKVTVRVSRIAMTHLIGFPVRWAAVSIARDDVTRHVARAALAVAGMLSLIWQPPIQVNAHEAGVGAINECALSARSTPRAVVRVVDGATLLLDDGTRVRLIGAMAPNVLDAQAATPRREEGEGSGVPGDDMVWPPVDAARRALSDLIAGQAVVMATAGRASDRYGNLLAHVFVQQPGSGRLWVQGAMLTSGHARAYGMPDNYACMDALLAAEAPARSARTGLWSNSAYAIRHAWRTQELMVLRGTFQLVEGRVVKAQRVKSGWIYLNFGKDWRSDFSVAVAPGVSRSHAAWAAGLLDLEGAEVRVRGFIDRRNGPLITIEHPSQIEVLADRGATGKSADGPASP